MQATTHPRHTRIFAASLPLDDVMDSRAASAFAKRKGRIVSGQFIRESGHRRNFHGFDWTPGKGLFTWGKSSVLKKTVVRRGSSFEMLVDRISLNASASERLPDGW